MTSTPIAEGLFTWPSPEPTLTGGLCADCGAVSFPLRTVCPRCGATPLTAEPLERDGTLWSWTSQGFRPKAPFAGAPTSGQFVPWYVGLVELGGRIRIEGLLTNVREEALEIGMPMRLVVMPFGITDDGNTTVTFAFEPSTAAPAPLSETVEAHA